MKKSKYADLVNSIPGVNYFGLLSFTFCYAFHLQFKVDSFTTAA